MSPNKTGTRMTSNCRVAAPWRTHSCVPRRDSSRRLFGIDENSQAGVEMSLDAARMSACGTVRLVIRFWFLVPTRSYKFRLLLVLRPFFLRLLLFHRRQKWLDRIPHLSLFIMRERTDESRRYHHH